MFGAGSPANVWAKQAQRDAVVAPTAEQLRAAILLLGTASRSQLTSALSSLKDPLAGARVGSAAEQLQPAAAHLRAQQLRDEIAAETHAMKAKSQRLDASASDLTSLPHDLLVKVVAALEEKTIAELGQMAKIFHLAGPSVCEAALRKRAEDQGIEIPDETSTPHTLRFLLKHVRDEKAAMKKRYIRNSEPVNLKLVTSDGQDWYFKLRTLTPLKDLMNAFCIRQGLQRGEVTFFFDGVRIEDDEQTPGDFDMEDGDVIDATIPDGVGGGAGGGAGGGGDDDDDDDE